jgi:hypothetical protein
MTLRDLEDRAARGEDDLLLTLRQVANMTGTRYETVRNWRKDGSIPVVLWGPHRKPRVQASVVLEMFCPHQAAPRPVRVVPSHLRPCGPRDRC